MVAISVHRLQQLLMLMRCGCNGTRMVVNGCRWMLKMDAVGGLGGHPGTRLPALALFFGTVGRSGTLAAPFPSASPAFPTDTRIHRRERRLSIGLLCARLGCD